MYAFKMIEDDQGLIITTRKDKARHAAKVAGMKAARAARDANALALAAAAVAQAIANINNANADATNNANANVVQGNANQVATGSNVATMTAGPSVGNTNTNTNAAAAYNPGPVRPTHQHVNQGNTPAPLKRSPRIYNIACYREVDASNLRDHEKKRWFYWLKFHENAMYIARLNDEDIKPFWNTYEDVEDDDE